MRSNLTIEDIKQVAIPIAIEFGVGRLALFGSYARGEHHEYSDIDFLIEKGNIRDFFQYNDFLQRLEDELGVPVDLVTYDALKSSMIADVIKEEVLLYERKDS